MDYDNFYQNKFDEIHKKTIVYYKKLYGYPPDKDLPPVLERMAHTHACEQMRVYRRFQRFVFDNAVFGFDEAVEKIESITSNN